MISTKKGTEKMKSLNSNLCRYDYSNTEHLEKIQDFPRVPDGGRH